ncbi:hypothetical protein PVK06_034809 [Gossypium arboreum]|uniref:Uncharacterized protein n=1 Tax=Gossypium arboreum TaxID=29729 RepID=A0ABR0NF88_GOSAR|nr:hypothetical protein PVK06_034809 [Gossypium arboreum]
MTIVGKSSTLHCKSSKLHLLKAEAIGWSKLAAPAGASLILSFFNLLGCYKKMPVMNDVINMIIFHSQKKKKKKKTIFLAWGISARADDYTQDGRWCTKKIVDDRDGGTSVAAAARLSSPPASNNPNQATCDLVTQHLLQVKRWRLSMNLIHVFQFQDSLAFVPTILETPAAEADALAKSGALPTFSDNQQASNFGNQAPVNSQMAAQPQSPAVLAALLSLGNFFVWLDLLCQLVLPLLLKTTNESGAHSNNNDLGGFFSLPGSYTSMAQQTAPPLSTAAPVIVPQLRG